MNVGVINEEVRTPACRAIVIRATDASPLDAGAHETAGSAFDGVDPAVVSTRD